MSNENTVVLFPGSVVAVVLLGSMNLQQTSVIMCMFQALN